MARSESRPKRWVKAVAEVQTYLGEIEASKAQAVEAMQELESLRLEYEEMRDNVPENLQSSAYYERLDAVASLDFSTEEVEEMASVIEEADGIELPLGFGRD